MTALRVAGFLNNSSVNGIGLRSVLFLSGCHHACPYCHNTLMQDEDYGETIDINNILTTILKNEPIIDGVTISGGEPFLQAENLLPLIRLIKSNNLNIWIYSGYTYEELVLNKINVDILKLVDVLIDGRFIISKHDKNLLYRGSSNQRIISLINGEIDSILDF